MQLWTEADEENKQMILYGIDSREDPVAMVMRIRAEAGLPPEDWNNAAPDDASCIPSDPHLIPSAPVFMPNDPNFIPADPGFIPNDAGFSSTWDNVGHQPGTYSIGSNHVFNSRGPGPGRFRSPAFRPPVFPPRGRFATGGPCGPRSHGLRPFAPGGFPGSRAHPGGAPACSGVDSGRGFEAPGPVAVGSNNARGGVGPIRAGLGRGRDAPAKPHRGNTSSLLTRGISRGGLHPRGGGFGPSAEDSRKVVRPPPATWSDRPNRFDPPPPAVVHQTSRANSQPWDRPPVLQSNNLRPTSRLPPQFSPDIPPLRNTASRQSAGLGTKLRRAPPVAVSSSSAGAALHTTAIPASSQWNPVQLSSSTFYSPPAPVAIKTELPVYAPQQASRAVTTPNIYPDTSYVTVTAQNVYPTNPAVHAPNAVTTLDFSFPANASIGTTVSASAGVGQQQYNMNTAAWSGLTHADYLAYYNSYLQSIGGASDVGNSSVAMSVPPSSTVQPAFDAGLQTNGLDYASQALAYAAYYNACYAAADPGQNQLMNNYLYSYDANSAKPT